MVSDLEPAGFLVVDDHELVARAFANVIRQHAPAEIVGTIADAEAALARKTWIGIVLDVGLPDGSGLELLARLRHDGAHTPVLVVTGGRDHAVANRAHRLGASCVFKPDVSEDLAIFVSRARARAAHTKERTAAALQVLRSSLHLSKRESQIAELVTLGVARSELADRLGVSENTIKTTVRNLLTKCGTDRVEGVARAVLEQVVLSMVETAAER